MTIIVSPETFPNCVLVGSAYSGVVDEIAERLPPIDEAEDDEDTYTVFRHTPRVAAAFREYGVGVPYPTKINRDFPLMVKGQRMKPFKHQIATARFLINNMETANGSAFVLSDAGTGKTLSVLWAWWYLRQLGMAGALLVLCPKSIVFSAWQKDIMASIPQAKVAYVVGDKKKRDNLCIDGYDIFVVNHDGIKSNPKLLRLSSITHVAIDEASAFNDRNTERFKRLREFCRSRTVWAMTATPVSHSPDRAWALAQLVDKSRVEPTFGRFRSRVCYEIKMGQFSKWNPKPGSEHLVYEALQPAIRFKKSDCLDLPPLVFEDRQVTMTPDQKKFADKLIKDWQWEEMHGNSATATISADNAAIRVNKLLQCYQGVIIRDDKSLLKIDCAPRLTELESLIDESEGKIIVAAPFKGVIAMVVEHLNKRYEKTHGRGFAASITGDTALGERTQLVNNMQDPAHNLRVLVVHPETASHGLTLTEASTTVWYGPYFKSEFYAQLNERMNRPGQVRSMRIVNLVADRVEQEIFDLVRSRLDTQDRVLSLYKRIVGA